MSGLLDATFRRFVPSLPPLTRNRVLMAPLDAIDYLARAGQSDLAGLPPNRMRIRTGVGNRLLGNGAYWVGSGRDFWSQQFDAGRVRADSSILDLGCGCGRCAIAIDRFGIGGQPFTGKYLGLDVDREMISWCAANMDPARFRFAHVAKRSEVYSPNETADSGASGKVFAAGDGSIDFLFAISVFSHLLEKDFIQYVHESRRVLRPGGRVLFSTFCMEDVDSGPDRRWSFKHRWGATFVESERYPEAATGYERDWVIDQGIRAGLEFETTIPSPVQTCFVFRAK